MLRNLDCAPYNDKKNEAAIKSDIYILQQSASKADFKRAKSLFIKKWCRVEPDFCKYFEKQWLRDAMNWYAGFSLFLPSDNNAQEGFNNAIKRDLENDCR